MKKSEKQKPAGSDVLTTTAEAIGSTLGKIAVKTGLVKPMPQAARPKAPLKKMVKAAAPAKRKAVRKAASKATVRGGKKGK